MTPEEWERRGSRVDTTDGGVFTAELGEASTGTPVLALHGFPTSSWDFVECANALADGRRVILFDFLGFGLSAKPADHGYSLFEQADVAIAVVRARGLERVHLWAHDMGTSVATELLARRERGLLPFEVESVVLMNGSVHVEMASPTIGQRLLMSPMGDAFARVSRRAIFAAQIARVFARPPEARVVDGMWTLLSREDGVRRLPQIIRYMAERARFERRWVGALERLDIPSLVAWGEQDPVAVLAIAKRLARETPRAKLVTWPELGHYPQIEDPIAVARAIAEFWAGIDR